MVFFTSLLISLALLPAGCRKAAIAGISFTQGLKISIFAAQGRLDAPIHVKLGTAERHGTWVLLAMRNLT